MPKWIIHLEYDDEIEAPTKEKARMILLDDAWSIMEEADITEKEGEE